MTPGCHSTLNFALFEIRRKKEKGEMSLSPLHLFFVCHGGREGERVGESIPCLAYYQRAWEGKRGKAPSPSLSAFGRMREEGQSMEGVEGEVRANPPLTAVPRKSGRGGRALSLFLGGGGAIKGLGRSRLTTEKGGKLLSPFSV